MTDINFNIYCN
eukprot:UN01149